MCLEFDNYLSTDIEIANFDTSYSELLKKIAKTNDYIQQKREYWARAEKALNPGGSIGQLMLQKAFDDNLFRIASGTHNSVKIDNNGITVTDITNPNKMVRINAGIVSLTTDGGLTWNTALSSMGVSFKYAIGGRIDINEIALYGNNHFYWNHRGLYAINPNNSSHWVKFDNNGIVSTLDNGNSYEFSLTWAGLQIGKHSIAGLQDDLDDLQTGINDALNAVDYARTYAELKADEAYDAAADLAEAKAELAEANAAAYTDGLVTAEEQARIDQAAANLATAQFHADQKALDAENAAKAHADSAAIAAQEAAEAVAVAQAALAQANAIAYADGVVTAEEQARINQAVGILATAQAAQTTANNAAAAAANSVQQNTSYNSVVINPSDGVKAMHPDGSYTRMYGGGLVRYDAGTEHTYNYLVYTGSASTTGGGWEIPTNPTTITLPAEFHGKQFKVTAFFQNCNSIGPYFLRNITCKVLPSINYAAGQFVVEGYMEVYPDAAHANDYFWGRAPLDFAYIAQY